MKFIKDNIKRFKMLLELIDGFLAIFLFICGIVHDFLYHDFLVMHDFNNILHVKVSNFEVNPNHSANNNIKLKKKKDSDSIKNNISLFSQEFPPNNEEITIETLK
jgi:hypothetical protein